MAVLIKGCLLTSICHSALFKNKKEASNCISSNRVPKVQQVVILMIGISLLTLILFGIWTIELLACMFRNNEVL